MIKVAGGINMFKAIKEFADFNEKMNKKMNKIRKEQHNPIFDNFDKEFYEKLKNNRKFISDVKNSLYTKR